MFIHSEIMLKQRGFINFFFFKIFFEIFLYHIISLLFKIETVWSSLSTNQQKAIFFDLIERLESVETDVRLDSARIILYILQVFLQVFFILG